MLRVFFGETFEDFSHGKALKPMKSAAQLSLNKLFMVIHKFMIFQFVKLSRATVFYNMPHKTINLKRKERERGKNKTNMQIN